MIIGLFVGIVVCGLIGLIVLSVHGDGNLANVGIAIANIAGIVSSLVVLPKIIAEHLFPVDEESNMIGMVKNMQENDANIRNVIFSNDENKRPEGKRTNLDLRDKRHQIDGVKLIRDGKCNKIIKRRQKKDTK